MTQSMDGTSEFDNMEITPEIQSLVDALSASSCGGHRWTNEQERQFDEYIDHLWQDTSFPTRKPTSIFEDPSDDRKLQARQRSALWCGEDISELPIGLEFDDYEEAMSHLD
ncbi:hypothetical protein C7H19_20040 [Aphanothece hegewaldii CCALA 016]|uniref:Uncharacterized protein n=1 Tax=Aphanothece hegewaldii CCALA 016 TaxID=2107694 RepID=A0A2T1LT37_9CHRO|nr:hypothetical protein [Aphanothece hegewaldii]PSF33462.1 hypothetical protein C7H19_20040 [Aphanothece hegewaldii CCALA 016]